jgi:hypothetical protein
MKTTEALAERFNETRKDLAERAEMSREELAMRAEQLRAQFSEHVTQEAVTTFTGWTLVSTGVAWGVTDFMRGRRGMRSLILPMALIAMGAAVLGGGTLLHRRAAQISDAEIRVREQLSELGPFARARVLRDVSEDTPPLVRRIAMRN